MRAPHLSVIVLLSFPPAVLVASPAVAPFAKLQLAFEPRESGPRQQYVARAGGYSIALQGGNATISGGASNIQMRFVGSRDVAGKAGDELPGKVNYVHGSDPKQWQIGLPTYASVTYREIYPGIDVVYRGNQGQMEFDLLLKPRADAGRIRLRFAGAQKVSVDADGALLVHHSQGVFAYRCLRSIRTSTASESRSRAGMFCCRTPRWRSASTPTTAPSRS